MAGASVKKRILVVDDEPVIRSLAQITLESEEWQVALADDASTALAEIGRSRPDLIFLDLGLPGVPGDELARRIRLNESMADIPIVYLTGMAPDSCGEADDIVTKPFTPAILRQSASNWLH
jgi:two-component system phosphate regulon response regulator PhoB